MKNLKTLSFARIAACLLQCVRRQGALRLLAKPLALRLLAERLVLHPVAIAPLQGQLPVAVLLHTDLQQSEAATLDQDLAELAVMAAVVSAVAEETYLAKARERA